MQRLALDGSCTGASHVESLHDSQTHETADGDFVLKRQSQVPDDSNRKKCADDIGENRHGCNLKLAVKLRVAGLLHPEVNRTSLQIDGVNSDIGIPAAICLAGPIGRDGITLCQQDNFGEQSGQDEQDHERPKPVS